MALLFISFRSAPFGSNRRRLCPSQSPLLASGSEKRRTRGGLRQGRVRLQERGKKTHTLTLSHSSSLQSRAVSPSTATHLFEKLSVAGRAPVRSHNAVDGAVPAAEPRKPNGNTHGRRTRGEARERKKRGGKNGEGAGTQSGDVIRNHHRESPMKVRKSQRRTGDDGRQLVALDTAISPHIPLPSVSPCYRQSADSQRGALPPSALAVCVSK